MAEQAKKYFAYNRESQQKAIPNHFEPFLRNVPKDKLFTLATDKSTEDNGIRILPAWDEKGWIALVTALHFNVGINRNTFICPNLISEGDCPFCPVVSKLKSEYEKYRVDISAAGAKTRAYSNVVNTKVPQVGTLVFSYGIKILEPIMKYQDCGEYGDITDPLEGRDIFIDRKVTGKNQFQDSIRVAGKPSMLQNPDALDQLFDLDTILPEINMEIVNKAFKSHPWKIYNAPMSVQVPVSFESTPKEEEVAEPTPTASAGLPAGKAEEIAAKLRAKMGK